MSEEISVSLETAQAERKLAEVVAATESVQADGDELERSADEAERKTRAVAQRKRQEPAAGPSPAGMEIAGLIGGLSGQAPVIAALVASGMIEALDALLARYEASNLGQALERLREIARRLAVAWGFDPDREESGG